MQSAFSDEGKPVSIWFDKVHQIKTHVGSYQRRQDQITLENEPDYIHWTNCFMASIGHAGNKSRPVNRE